TGFPQNSPQMNENSSLRCFVFQPLARGPPIAQPLRVELLNEVSRRAHLSSHAPATVFTVFAKSSPPVLFKATFRPFPCFPVPALEKSRSFSQTASSSYTSWQSNPARQFI